MTGSEATPIMLVEDTPEDCSLLQMILERQGLTINWQIASTFAEARGLLDQIRAGTLLRPAMSILDLRLPDGYGADLVPLIRSQCGDWPIVIHSTSDAPEDRRHADPTTDVHYACKPYDLAGFDPLIAHVRQAIARHPAGHH